jgi:hypothetical protein
MDKQTKCKQTDRWEDKTASQVDKSTNKQLYIDRHSDRESDRWKVRQANIQT